MEQQNLVGLIGKWKYDTGRNKAFYIFGVVTNHRKVRTSLIQFAQFYTGRAGGGGSTLNAGKLAHA